MTGNEKSVGIDIGESNHEFADSVTRSIIESAAQSGDYKGIGGHDSQTHGPHGTHTQTSLGIGDRTVNIRKTD